MWVATTVAPAGSAAGQVARVGEAADVVAHHRPRSVGRRRHRRPPRVARDRDVEAGGQGGHRRDHPLELLDLVHLRPRARLDTADVEHVGAVGHELVGPAEEGVEREVGALVEERVGRAVEDAHHQRPVPEVVGPVPELEVHARGRYRRGATVTPGHGGARG
jgi:hypothetical protein